ncbi:MAG TPA: DoxX-like family protein [Chthoniobacterales bacterium]|nr:DoxX-like family protein [Chthoniobacterales bacterium]
MSASFLLPPLWLIHIAVAAVWLYEGLWCKLLTGEPHQMRVVEAVPRYGSRVASGLLKALGVVEVAVAVWVLTGMAPIICAVCQTALLVVLNACGLFWARHLIHDPAGMVVKNFAFLVLAWVSASFPAWS